MSTGNQQSPQGGPLNGDLVGIRVGQDALNDAASDAAAAWIGRLAAHNVTAAERADFRRWHGQADAHRAAFDTMMAVWSRLDVLELVPVEVPAQRKPYSRIVSFAWPWAAAAVVLGLIALVRFSPAQLEQSGIGERRSVALVDGSTLWLNTRTQVSHRIGGRTRELELEQGEVFVHVAPDARRPFSVHTPRGTVTAVGTAFGVERLPEGDRLAVTEGVVHLQLAQAADADAVRIEAGRVVVFDGASIRLLADRPDDVLAWRQGELVYSEVPLAEVIRDLNRYLETPMTITDPELARRPVSAVLRLQNQAAMLDALAAALGLNWQRQPDSIVIRG